MRVPNLLPLASLRPTRIEARPPNGAAARLRRVTRAAHLKRGYETRALPIRIPDAGRGFRTGARSAGALVLRRSGGAPRCPKPEAERDRPLSRVRAEAGSRSPVGGCSRACDHWGRAPGPRACKGSASGGSLEGRRYVQFTPAAYSR
jgi:hypothetical protein